MADKIKDSVLNSVVGGKDEGITYKYKSGDCFRSISGQFIYYEIIEPAGRIDEISNTPIYKCNMYVAYSIAGHKVGKLEKEFSESLLDRYEKINCIPKGVK